MTAPSLRLSGVSHAFGDVTVLHDVNLTVAPGDVVALIGPSGCGKSTLLEIAVGLTIPTEGRVAVGDRATTGRPGSVSYMPQSDVLFPWRTVAENISLGLEIVGMTRREAVAEAVPLLERVGLGDVSTRDPRTLSGGMRQRVAFLRTLIQRRPFMLLDEPFGALDGLTRADLHAWLLDVWQGHDGDRPGVVIVTHDIAEALLLSDTVAVMDRGRVLASLPTMIDRPRSIATMSTPVFAARERALRDVLGGLVASRETGELPRGG